MDTPLTQIDERFSDAGATATPWAETREVLATAELSWLATVRADGRPHVTPLVAVWDEGALHFCTGPDEQKAVNLANNPEVALTTGCGRWDDGLDVTVEGKARRVTDPATFARLAARWATKWDGRWRFEVGEEGFGHERGGLALVYRVEPRKVLAFRKGTFSHTRHLPDTR